MRKLLLALVATLLGVALIELALRVVEPDDFSPTGTLSFMAWNPFRGNYLLPGYQNESIQINSMGMRGPEPDPARARRIVCMGDSSTFGVWVEGVNAERTFHYDSYPEILAAELERAGHVKWQVVNAGVPGSTAAHSLRILRREVLALKPEIITLRVGVNDHAIARSPFAREPDSRWLRGLFYRVGHTRLFQRLVQARFWLDRDEALPIADEPTFVGDIREFERVVRRHGIRLVLIDYPLRPQRVEDPVARNTARFWGGVEVDRYYADHARYEEALRSFARAQNVPLLVTAPDLIASGFSDDIVHPSATGMRMIAIRLFEFLVEQGWLDDATGR